jgi:hypothetical protein
MSDNAASVPLEKRIAALEAKVGKSKPKAPETKGPSLVELNRKAVEASREKRAVKSEASAIAQKAVADAFKTRPGKTVQRAQKDLSPGGAELRFAAAKSAQK